MKVKVTVKEHNLQPALDFWMLGKANNAKNNTFYNLAERRWNARITRKLNADILVGVELPF